MTGNRVEELENTVAQLEATVSGLTDELVETKERLRLIEDHFGPELDDIIEGQTSRSPKHAEETTAASEPACSQNTRGCNTGQPATPPTATTGSRTSLTWSIATLTRTEGTTNEHRHRPRRWC